MTSILKVDTIQDADGNNIINESGNTITIGASGDTTNIIGTLQNDGAGLISGITMADQWRITSDHSGVAVITANWERVDTEGYGTIGSAMTESSGIFTFPSTGIYHINFIASAYTSGGSTGFMRIGIETTVNNSSYGEATNGYMSMYTDGAYSSSSTLFIFDVTDTSTHKVRFALNQNSSATPKLVGNTGDSYTYVNFIRLGDT
jgi:hypothetical protein